MNADLVRSIAAVLASRGVTKKIAVAELLGESPSQFSRYLNGHRSPQVATVAEWLRRAAAAGHPIRLEWSIEGCIAYAGE